MDKNKIIFFLFLCSFSIYIENVYGMFEAILTHGEGLYADNDKWNVDNLKIKRFNKTTYVIDGYIEVRFDEANEAELYCFLFKKAGNEYKRLPYKYGPKKLCDFVKEEKLFYPEFLNYTENFPPLGTCDFKKGKYIIHNYMPDLGNVPPVFESGDYMIECQALQNDGSVANSYKIFAQVFNYANAQPSMSGKQPGM